MKTTRLEAFSDGVLAIIITIMVLELKVPHAVDLAALKPRLPVLLSYVLSLIYLGIYWNNHHHLFQAAKEVSGGILWANLHLSFLAVALSLHYGLDGAKPSRSYADRCIWLRSADGRNCLLHFATYHHRQGRSGLAPCLGCRRRLEGKPFAGALSRRDSARVRELMDRQWHIRVGCSSLVNS